MGAQERLICSQPKFAYTREPANAGFFGVIVAAGLILNAWIRTVRISTKYNARGRNDDPVLKSCLSASAGLCGLSAKRMQ